MYRMQRPNIRQLTLALYDEEKKSSPIFYSPFSLFNSLLYSLAYLQARPHSVV